MNRPCLHTFLHSFSARRRRSDVPPCRGGAGSGSGTTERGPPPPRGELEVPPPYRLAFLSKANGRVRENFPLTSGPAARDARSNAARLGRGFLCLEKDRRLAVGFGGGLSLRMEGTG
jgi:hypothetical protein